MNAKRLVGSVIRSGSKEDELELKPKYNSFIAKNIFT